MKDQSSRCERLQALRRPAFTLVELLACVLCLLLLGGVAGVLGRPDGKALPWKGLVAIARATAQYQNDNANRVPFVLSYTRGTVAGVGNNGGNVGFCTWSWGGKNNNGFWATGRNSIFDVEAADRPMNQYLYPGRVFYAPPPPQTLPANDPARLVEATAFRDPLGDKASFQRSWPNKNSTITTYDDVGTSWMSNFAWFSQLFDAGYSFEGAVAEGNRRIAVGQGAVPSRFVWLADQNADVVLNQFGTYSLTNAYGDKNMGSMLFLDGHVGYESLTPQKFTTSRYTFKFE